MKTYQVGGAVRDNLLGLPIKDRDWVVVGATPQQMLEQGFHQVGKDFPVFLHPHNKEEYALARTERKTAPGYQGFAFHAALDVTLEQDLVRRDLTINAMACDSTGEIIDPFGGQQDLKDKKLRHVSAAFLEDPVRILRVARFYARFAPLGFSIAAETMALMRKMVVGGEVDALVPERVWVETDKALAEAQPSCFFYALRECGALAKLYPEIDALFGVPQPEKHHPEIDAGIHTMLVLDRAAQLSLDNKVRFAALMHDLGKGNTAKSEWPRHIGHEQRSVALLKPLCRRLRVPNEYRDLAIITAEYHTHCHRFLELKEATILKVLQAVDAFRRPERFEAFLLSCQADSQGRQGCETKGYPQAELFLQAYHVANAVGVAEFVQKGLFGQAFAEALRQRRIQAIKEMSGRE